MNTIRLSFLRAIRFGLALLLVLAVLTSAACPISFFVSEAEEEGSGESALQERGMIVVGYCQDGDYYEFDYQIFQIGVGLVEEEAITCAPDRKSVV